MRIWAGPGQMAVREAVWLRGYANMLEAEMPVSVPTT